MAYGEINAVGHTNFIAWLESVLLEPHYALRIADKLTSEVDGSYAEDCGMSIEVPSHYTRSGSPLIYLFGQNEFDLVSDED